MDNHESHCTVDSIVYARDKGIILLTFPPHCSHRLKPMRVGVVRKFKGKLCLAQHDLMTANPAKMIPVLHLASLENTVNQSSFTAKNITAAFAKKGIWQLSCLAFSDGNFEPSSVTPMEKDLVVRPNCVCVTL